MFSKLFSKTKSLSIIHSKFKLQYNNISVAVIEYLARKEDFDFIHGKRLFGDLESLITTQINEGIIDLKQNFTTAFENEFLYLRSKENKSLIKWLNSPSTSIPKFVSQQFIANNIEFIFEHKIVPFCTISVRENEAIRNISFIKNTVSKYSKQNNFLSQLGNTHYKPLLLKSNLKSKKILTELEKTINDFVESFNGFIRHHFVDKIYDFSTDLLNKDFNTDTLREVILFFNIILNLIEDKKIGINQPDLVFIKNSEFNDIDFDKDFWLPLFRDFGIYIVED